MPETAAKSVIVTFKRKDKRSDKKKDKVALLTAAIERDIDVFNMTTLATGAQLPRGLAPDSIGFDINRYETPIITATVTEKELQALKKSKDIASVEEDAPMRAFTGGPSLLFEGQPSVTAETVPSGWDQAGATCDEDAHQRPISRSRRDLRTGCSFLAAAGGLTVDVGGSVAGLDGGSVAGLGDGSVAGLGDASAVTSGRISRGPGVAAASGRSTGSPRSAMTSESRASMRRAMSFSGSISRASAASS